MNDPNIGHNFWKMFLNSFGLNNCDLNPITDVIILFWVFFLLHTCIPHSAGVALISTTLPGGDSGIFLSHCTTEQRGLQDGEAPADGLRPPQQLSVRGAAPLAHLPRAGLHHQGVHETGQPAHDVILIALSKTLR